MQLTRWMVCLLIASAAAFIGCSAPELAEDSLSPGQGSEVHLEVAHEPAVRPAPSSPHNLRLNDLQRRASDGDANALAELTEIAESGDAWAQHVLGLTYNRKNRSGEHPESAKWFRKAAAQGVLYSVATLGFQYAHGHGVEKDLERGAGLLQAAADMGEVLSQHNLGDLYRAPAGLPTDLAQTYGWLTIALATLPESTIASLESRTMLIETTKNRRDLLAKRMTPEQIAEGERIAAQWRKKTWEEVRDDVQRFL